MPFLSSNQQCQSTGPHDSELKHVWLLMLLLAGDWRGGRVVVVLSVCSATSGPRCSASLVRRARAHTLLPTGAQRRRRRGGVLPRRARTANRLPFPDLRRRLRSGRRRRSVESKDLGGIDQPLPGLRRPADRCPPLASLPRAVDRRRGRSRCGGGDTDTGSAGRRVPSAADLHRRHLPHRGRRLGYRRK